MYLDHCRTCFLELIIDSGIDESAAQVRSGIPSHFHALEGMRRNDSDIYVVFLTAAVKYTSPVDDPLFFALESVTKVDTATGKNITLYIPEHPLAAVGCAVQVSGTQCGTQVQAPDK